MSESSLELAGLYLVHASPGQNESDYVHDITIQNNQILDCDGSVSAFRIHRNNASVGNTNNDLDPITGNSNIVISNLLILGTAAPSNIYVGAITNVSLAIMVI